MGMRVHSQVGIGRFFNFDHWENSRSPPKRQIFYRIYRHAVIIGHNIKTAAITNNHYAGFAPETVERFGILLFTKSKLPLQ